MLTDYGSSILCVSTETLQMVCYCGAPQWRPNSDLQHLALATEKVEAIHSSRLLSDWNFGLFSCSVLYGYDFGQRPADIHRCMQLLSEGGPLPCRLLSTVLTAFPPRHIDGVQQL